MDLPRKYIYLYIYILMKYCVVFLICYYKNDCENLRLCMTILRWFASLREVPDVSSAVTPFNPTEDCHGSPQSFLANVAIMPEDRPRPIPCTSFQMYFLPFSKHPALCIFSFTDRDIK
jgi:hypothetical protein